MSDKPRVRKSVWILATVAMIAAAGLLAYNYRDNIERMRCDSGPCPSRSELQRLCSAFYEADLTGQQGEAMLDWVAQETANETPTTAAAALLAEARALPADQAYARIKKVAVEIGHDGWQCPAIERFFAARWRVDQNRL